MAELDPIVAEILLKGDDELLKSLQKIGTEGAEHIKKVAEACENGATPLQAFGGAIGIIASAVSTATAALVVFIEQQTELSQKTELLADAFGVTAGQLQELEAVFAASGVKVEQFERFANRLTITIAREWPQIAESIKNYATENDAATLRINNAILGIRDAQNRLGDNSAERAAQMAKDNDGLQASYIKLQFAAQHAASERISAAQGVRGAELSTLAAVQNLAALEGRPPSAAEKQNLQIAQAQQAVDQARRAEADARIAQQEKAANATLKQRQLEQEYDDLRRKAAKNARDDAENRQKDENAVKQAVIARAEAEQKAAKFALTNIESVRDSLKGIVDGNKGASHAIELTAVTVDNLTKGMIALAAESAKGIKPTGFEALSTIARVLTNDTEHLIDKEQRLAIVNHLASTSMRNLGISGAEILHILENDSKAIDELTKHADAMAKIDPEGIKAFRKSLSLLNLDLTLLNQEFASWAAPTFTAFLEAVRSSLKDDDGLLHNFISGLKVLGSAIGLIKDAFVALGGLIDTAFGAAATKGNGLKLLLMGIALIAATIGGPFTAIPIIIGLIIVAMGSLSDIVSKNKAAIVEWWQEWEKSPAIQICERILGFLGKMAAYLGGPLKALFGGGDKVGGNAPSSSGGKRASASDLTEGTTPMATGGEVHGPGTTTSDSVFARLSRGEFVMKAAAVQNYGTGLFHALNNMMLPGFAQGGLVPSPVRLGGGGVVPATSTLNLSIDGRSFNGLRGPKSTIDDLSSFAIARQTSAAGSNPSWMK